jgi:hypothetical protein
MKTYSVRKEEQRFLPATFSLRFSPRNMNVVVSFPPSEQPDQFDWKWNRLCGLAYVSGEEIGIAFRHNPLTKNIELCGYYNTNESEGSQGTDYVPFPFMTLGTIQVNISDEFIAFRFDIDGKVYIRRIDAELYIDSIAYKLGPKMHKPSHTDFSIAMDFK